MAKIVQIGDRFVGEGYPAYILGEIGINHNGDLDIARRLIDAAQVAGCDAVKFQKRTPELCVPPEQRSVIRETPWGLMTYMAYRERVEFDEAAYQEINHYAEAREIGWFVSVWDYKSVDFMEPFDPICYKLPSAALTDHDLLRHVRGTKRPMILSTGMSTMQQIRDAIDVVGTEDLILLHSTSSYPCKTEEINLRMIHTLKQEFDCPIGYSGHEVGLQITYAAVALGACFIERHITLDRAMWGSDQAASIEPWGLMRLVRDIRVIEAALGDGVKRVYESEMPSIKKLRRVTTS